MAAAKVAAAKVAAAKVATAKVVAAKVETLHSFISSIVHFATSLKIVGFSAILTRFDLILDLIFANFRS